MVYITFHYRYRKQILIGFLIICILSSGIGIFLFTKKPKKDKPKEEVILVKKDSLEKDNKETTLYTVDIKGQINNPGIYTMEKGSRVIDVIEKAGGMNENADTSVINLSKKIQDEMVIIIYSHEEVINFEKTKEKEDEIQSTCIQPNENALKNDACITPTDKPNGKISINNASKEELMTLPGIGESKANEIINYRKTNGPFETIEDIQKVPGIGEARFAAIKEDITV